MAVPKVLLPFATAFSLALVGAIRLTIAQSSGNAPAGDAAPADKADIAAPRAASPAANDVVLADEQAKLAAKYKELERVVLRMAEVMQSTDPRRAALLRQAFAQSKERQIGTQFEDLVKLLKTEQLYQASKGQVAVDQDLNKLLQLLMSGDRDKQIPNERAEIKRFIERINKLIREQQGIEGETEGQGDAAELAKRQDKLADRTVELAKDLHQFDARNNPDAGDKVDRENADGKNAEGKDAEGKEADGKSADGKNGEKKGGKSNDQNGAESKQGDSEKGDAEKSDAEKGDPQQGESKGKSNSKSGSKQGAKKGSDASKSDAEKSEGSADEKSGEESKGGEQANGEKDGKSNSKSGSQKSGSKKSDGKKSSADGKKSDAQPGEKGDEKSDENADGQSGEKADGEKSGGQKAGKSGQKSSGQKGSKSGQKSSKSGEKSGQKSNAEKGEKSDSEKSDAEKSDAEKSDSEKSDEKKSDSEKSDGKSGQKSGKSGQKAGQKSGSKAGQKSDSKSGEKAKSQKSSKGSKGDPQEGEESEQQNSESEQSEEEQQNDEPQARKRIRQAEDRMRDAKRRLEEAERRGAAAEQQKAIEELKQAKAALEEILRQLREEEVERVLAMLEGRFRKMLQLQVEVYEGTIALDRIPEEERDRDIEIEAGKLSRKEAGISTEAEKTLTLLREEGSSVAFPESVEQMREDMEQVTARLGRANIGQITQGVEQDIVKALEETVTALQKAQREQQRGGQQQQQRQAGKKKGGAGGGGQPQDRPLVDSIAELKMIRALQMRVNTRTERYSRLLTDGTEQAEAPDLVEAVKRLSEREERIHKTTRDVVVGRNK